jgi:peptidoglycan hydrolase-like protein with peptidoglycan-binding domain
MANLKFINFTWPHNPSTFIISYENKIIRHEFPDVDGAETEELGLSPRIFSGSGVFYGSNAYSYFKNLSSYSVNNKVGTLIHPKYGKFTVRLSKLTSKEEPTPNYVEYDFEFIEHKDMPIIIKKTPTKKPSSNGKTVLKYKYPGVLKKGSKGENVKLVQGVVGVTKDGVFGPKTEAAVKVYQKKNKLTVDGIVGPKTWEKMFSIVEESDDKKKRYYVVKSGDTLGKISKIYYGTTTKWKKIADANKNIIKNPSSLKIGWKLYIPY